MSSLPTSSPSSTSQHSKFRKYLSVGLGLATLGVVGIVPLASTNGGVTIAGAQTLSDPVRIGKALVDGATTDIHVLGFNDLHGHIDGTTSGNQYGRYAGGAGALGKMILGLQRDYKGKTITVAAGDSIGATPLTSSLFEDEPTIMAKNFMNLDFASVGNHEFDRGQEHLLRMAQGGCPKSACLALSYPEQNNGRAKTFPGAQFPYLASNVKRKDGKPFLPAYGMKKISSSMGNELRFGVIGSVLRATPTIVTPGGIVGLEFLDEAEAANAAAKELVANGSKTNILVIHEGGFQSAAASKPGDCVGSLKGSPIEKIAAKLDKSIRVIVSGHTHTEYRCVVTTDGVDRLITSASSFGRILSDITLTVDSVTGELVTASAVNMIVENSTNPNTTARRVEDPTKIDADIAAMAAYFTTAAAPKANRVIGKVSADMSNATTAANGEVLLGDVIADTQLEATKTTGKAVIAFMNPGGIRAPGFVVNQISAGEQPGEITYAEAFTVQPFGNSLATKTMTGKQIRELLEQQFAGCRNQLTTRILQVSAGFSYEQSAGAATCDAKIGKITLDGKDIDPAADYRVTMNSFLATGGDGFTVFNDGKDTVGGDLDIDALTAYFALKGTLNPGPGNRIIAK
jgi:5'-nucleotidase